MKKSIQLAATTGLRVLGTRYLARRIRQSLSDDVVQSSGVEIDFTGTEVTQSFVDELLGPLLLRHGEKVLETVVFRGCSENARAVIMFVISGRLSDYEKLRSTVPAVRGASLQA
jgi:hypothetical protein